MERFLKIGEFAELIGVSTVTLRKWEDRGWLVPHHRSPSGYRYYTPSQANEVLSKNKKGGVNSSVR